MNNLATILFAFVFCFSLNLNAQQKDNDQKDSIQRPLLNNLRNKNAVKYQESRKKLQSQPKIKYSYRFEKCTPCDTRYIAQLLQKESLTKKEIKNAICTNQIQCKTNAEFRQMYNELIHRTIAVEPDRFFEIYEENTRNTQLNLLDEEILNPVNDRITNESVLKSLKTRIDRKANSNIQPVMLRRLEGKLESKIKLRNAELIKRKAVIQRQGGD